MTENQLMVIKLRKLLPRKLSKAGYATMLGVTVTEINKILSIIYKENKQSKKTNTNSRNINTDKGTLESIVTCDFEPKNPEDLANLHKVDLKVYSIVNYWSKLLPNGKFTSSVFCKTKDSKNYNIEDLKDFLKEYKSNYIPIEYPALSLAKQHVDIEISLADYHLAKKTIDGDNSPSKRVERYISVITSLITKVRSIYNINTLVFPISNDFFHTDNYQNQTTQGTPQDTIMTYSEEFELGFNLLVQSIKILLKNSKKVIVVLVQGNHDKTKSYYLAHGLSMYFANDERVVFDREHSVVKAITVGNTFIGYHHGNCKLEDLPLLFATHPNYSDNFGKAKYREIHTGDKHHYMAKEVKGVRIQQMPSLSGTDRWHADNNFVHSVRAALALVYDEEKGKICEFEERI
jgi:hypothetical protein